MTVKVGVEDNPVVRVPVYRTTGSAAVGAQVTVTTGGATATVYTDPEFTTTASNPLTADSAGVIQFYAPQGTYSFTCPDSGVAAIEDREVVTGGLTAAHLSGTYAPIEAVTTVAAAGAAQTLTAVDGGAATFDLTLSAADCTLTLAGSTAGKASTVTVLLRQDATGSRTVTWPSNIVWNGGLPPTLSTGAGYYDVVTLSTVDGGTTWDGLVNALGQVFSTPAAPFNVATSSTATDITVSWNAPNAHGSPITGYKVYRGTASGGETLLATVGNVSSYDDATAADATIYYYKVSAVNANGEGPESSEVTGSLANFGNGAHYLSLPGTSGNYASTPNASALNPAGDMTVLAKAALASWASGSSQALAAKWTGNSAFESWLLYVDGTGHLCFAVYDGAQRIFTSSAALGLAASATKWCKAVYVKDNGSSQHAVSFYTSDDNLTWTQLGTTQTVAATGATQSTTQVVEAGSSDTGTANLLNGKVYAIQATDDATATIVLQVDFSSKTAGQTSFADATGNTWTLHGTAAIV